MVGRMMPSGVCRNVPGVTAPGTGLPDAPEDHEYKTIRSPWR